MGHMADEAAATPTGLSWVGQRPPRGARSISRRALAAFAAAAFSCAVVACSNSSADSPPSTAQTSSTPSAVSASSAVADATSRDSSSPSPINSSETAPQTSASPWPSDLTPEQQAMAQAALTVYQQAWKVTDEAYADPTKDWEHTIRQYIADPRARQVLKAIQSLAADQEHTTGTSQVTAWVTTVEGSGDGAKVSIDACVDSSGADLLDATGHSIKAPMPAGSRIKQSGNVYRYSDKDGGWLLSEASIATPYEPC